MSRTKEQREAYYLSACAAHKALMKFYPLTIESLDGEEWEDIPDYEGLYQVSNFGRVKSTNHRKTHILKPVPASNGYLQFCLSKKNVHKPAYVARLVAQAFIPNLDNKPQVNHIDGHPMNNHVSNLEWATQAENQQHAFKIGLQLGQSGENNPRAKLTNEQVIHIRENPNNLTQYELAKLFNVKQSIISCIQLGKSYKHVEGTLRKPIVHLTAEQQSEIRRLYKPYSREFSTRALAKKFGCKPTTIWLIIHEEN